MKNYVWEIASNQMGVSIFESDTVATSALLEKFGSELEVVYVYAEDSFDKPRIVFESARFRKIRRLTEEDF